MNTQDGVIFLEESKVFKKLKEVAEDWKNPFHGLVFPKIIQLFGELATKGEKGILFFEGTGIIELIRQTVAEEERDLPKLVRFYILLFL
jgi:hypothetical protein